MSRKALGVIAVFLLVIGGVTAVSWPTGGSAAGFAGGCIRVGLVLGALWLALPQIQTTLARAPRWALSWFVGKGKRWDRSAPGAPPEVRKPRPRRRSNS
jgi:hypothetical protein